MDVSVIIPAHNEEKAIDHVINDIPKHLVNEIIVVDNNSTDQTSKVASNAGAKVLKESNPGYGNACLKGIHYLYSKESPPDIIVFLDGDYADYPEDMPELIAPIVKDNVDFVVASRALGEKEEGAMTAPQVFGNWLATTLLKMLYGVHFTDLGPFRAIKYEALRKLNMQDKTYGWTVEMQLKVAKHKLFYAEVPARYKKRIGVSKISGTIKGTILAGYKILVTIFKYL